MTPFWPDVSFKYSTAVSLQIGKDDEIWRTQEFKTGRAPKSGLAQTHFTERDQQKWRNRKLSEFEIPTLKFLFDRLRLYLKK